ncbi:DUF2497 domain-containing protein [Emcibacter sp. SYSU 3D8]|uniref:DUF2497 domain-containing protein n=1 Tax=Emcibacter sp. SYSU 3D8 TaxID=3133969 RepID=UPI0031FED7D9
MSKADNRPAEEMSMEDILASIRKMIAQDQDGMDSTRADRNAGVSSEGRQADDEVLDLVDELPEDSISVNEETVLSDVTPPWDAPPEAGIADLDGDQPEELLDLDAEFAIEDDAPPPADTADVPHPPEQPAVAPVDTSPLDQEPIMAGLRFASQVVEHENGEPYAQDVTRFADTPPPATGQAFDEPDTGIESTTAASESLTDGMAHEPHEEVASMDAPNERILSPEAAIKTSAAFDQFAQTLISGYEGDSNTLEGVVRAMLKPMLKEWLDANLPRLVEDIVQAEIRRLAR